MKVLVTGAPGWLGNRFLEVIAHGFEGEGSAADWDVRCLIHPKTSATSLQALQFPRTTLVEGDVTRPDTLGAAANGVDLVIHLAGIVHPLRVAEWDEVNAYGTRNLLAAAVAGGARRFVLISSDAVGGIRAPGSPLMTEADPPTPHGRYGRSKVAAEDWMRRVASRIETVVLRPFWFHGPHQPSRQTRFYRMMRSGRPFLFGDGRNLRSLSSTDNVCDALLRAATHPSAAGQTYWIADRRPYTTLEIYETIAELVGVDRLRPRRLPALVSAMCRLVDVAIQGARRYVSEIHVAGKMDRDIAAICDKARREIGYEPRIDLREGTRRAIAWCERNGQPV